MGQRKDYLDQTERPDRQTDSQNWLTGSVVRFHPQPSYKNTGKLCWCSNGRFSWLLLPPVLLKLGSLEINLNPVRELIADKTDRTDKHAK